MAILSGQVDTANRSFLQAVSKGKGTVNYSRSYFVNYSKIESRIFGDNVSQDIDNLYIKKVDLGLQPFKSYTAEALLIAILLRIKDNESDETSRIEVTYFARNWLTFNGVPVQRDILVVNLYGDLIYSNSPNPGMIDHIVNANTPIDASNFFV